MYRFGDQPVAGYPPPGTRVSVPIIFGYRHKGIVSDRWQGGKPMVISGSARAGRVCEEPWDAFASGGEVRNDGYPSDLPPWEVLRRSRALLGTSYRLFDFNCDHVVAVAHGQKPESPQVALTVAVAALVAALLVARAV